MECMAMEHYQPTPIVDADAPWGHVKHPLPHYRGTPGALCLRFGVAQGRSTAVNPSINHALGSGEDHFVVLCKQSLEKRISRRWIFFGPGFRICIHKKERWRLLEFCLQNIPGAWKNAI